MLAWASSALLGFDPRRAAVRQVRRTIRPSAASGGMASTPAISLPLGPLPPGAADLRSELVAAVEAACEAGQALLSFYHDNKPLDIRIKEDGSQVTAADDHSSELIMKSLAAFPYGVLNEELPDDGLRDLGTKSWIVDPLDGTKEFVRRTGDWGVMIGLLDERLKPVLGVTYRPCADELVYAVSGRGAYVIAGGLGNQATQLAPLRDVLESVVISSSRGESLQPAIDRLGAVKVSKMGSSLKACEVALGRATLYLCSPASVMSLWDLAAPQIIVQEAGGMFCDAYGGAFDFGSRVLQNKKGVICAAGVNVQGDALRAFRDAL